MIEIFVQSRYRVDRKLLRRRIASFLKKIGVDSDNYTVSVAVIGDRKMSKLHNQYAQKHGTTPVLAFPLMQGKPLVGEEIDKLYYDHILAQASRGIPVLLGEIVVSYPQILLFAADENKLVDTKLGEFVEHGLTRLLSVTS